jgi:transcriptional antiterminator NusG
MKPADVVKMLQVIESEGQAPATLQTEFKKGQHVKIKEGPFENFEGEVDEVIPAKGLVKVVVTIFSRKTPLELEYWQVEAV